MTFGKTLGFLYIILVETPAHAFRCGCELEEFTVDAHLKPFSLLEKDKERLPLLRVMSPRR